MNLVRLQRCTFQNPVNRCAPQTGHATELPSTPCVRSGKRPLTRQPNHLGTLPRRNARRAAPSRLVLETVKPFGCKALTPLQTIRPVQSATCAYLLQRQALCRQQDHVGTPTIPLLCPRSGNRPTFSAWFPAQQSTEISPTFWPWNTPMTKLITLLLEERNTSLHDTFFSSGDQLSKKPGTKTCKCSGSPLYGLMRTIDCLLSSC